MCGKAAVSHLAWKDVYAWATSLTPPGTLPANPSNRINISPSRLRRKSEPGSMIWETLPAIYADADTDRPTEATWPFLPYWSRGHHRSPAILRNPFEAQRWLRAPKQEALELLRPFPEESMAVQEVPMGIKIPGNEKISLPGCLERR